MPASEKDEKKFISIQDQITILLVEEKESFWSRADKKKKVIKFL